MYKNILFPKLSQLQLMLKFTKRTYHFKGNVLKLMNQGFFQEVFPAEYINVAEKRLTSKPQAMYAGFDPTSDSLHIGNLLILIGLIHCQRAGHQPIALLGGATGLVGDPSGRKTERTEITEEHQQHNLDCIKKQIETVFANHSEIFWKNAGESEPLKSVIVVNNAEWYNQINCIDFITKIGRYFRMGEMLGRASVQSRLNSETGMSFTEFTYQICQAYDWLHLYKKYQCRFQLGGNDQMGNMNSGHDIISKKEKKQVFALTIPLITNEEGDKFGKSAGQAIWLDSNKTSPYSLYQFFLRRPDSEVEKLLKLFTFLSISEINDLMERHKRTPELREPQKKIAEEVTLLIHGREGLLKAETISKALYQGDVSVLGHLPSSEIREIFKGAPFCELYLEPGLSILNLAMKVKCFPSETDAARIIKAGGFYVNQQRHTNISEIIVPGIHIMSNGLSLLRVGKRNYYIVKFIS